VITIRTLVDQISSWIPLLLVKIGVKSAKISNKNDDKMNMSIKKACISIVIKIGRSVCREVKKKI
jgi:hypothetical protein